MYKLKKIVGSKSFSAQFIIIISHYKKNTTRESVVFMRKSLDTTGEAVVSIREESEYH